MTRSLDLVRPQGLRRRAAMACLMCALPFVLGGCRPPGATVAAGPPTVLVTEVKEQLDLPVTRSWVSTLIGSTTSKIRARVQGYIQKQVYKDGSVVKVNDLLFEIDPRPFVAALEQAKAQLANAQAQQIETGLTEVRMVTLYKQSAVSEAERDKAVQDNAAAKATVQAMQANVQNAELNLSYTHVTAAISGIVSIAAVNVGDLVSPSSGDLATLATVDPIKAVFYVSEQEYMRNSASINAVADGRTDIVTATELILGDGALYPHKGYVSAVNLDVSEQTGTVKVDALFPNPGNTLRPGFFGMVRIMTRGAALHVPQRAVMEVQGKFLVAVVKPDNTVTIRSVAVGERVGSNWVITRGLARGECIIVEGTQKAREGAHVNPQPYVPAPVSNSAPATAATT